MTERRIPVPGGDSVSRDDGFAAWLELNDLLLDEFVLQDVPDMPQSPYSAAGLRVAEAEALRRFASAEDVLAPRNRELFDKFVRFVGEVFVGALGAQWTNKGLIDDGRAFVGVRVPGWPEVLEIPTMITSAVDRRTGTEWEFVFRNAAEDAGRPAR